MTEHIAADRKAKLERLQEEGIDPFPARVPTPIPIADCLERIAEREGEVVVVAGRLGQFRDFGKLRFSHLSDRGAHIQIGFQRDALAEFHARAEQLESLGDTRIVGAGFGERADR